MLFPATRSLQQFSFYHICWHGNWGRKVEHSSMAEKTYFKKLLKGSQWLLQKNFSYRTGWGCEDYTQPILTGLSNVNCHNKSLNLKNDGMCELQYICCWKYNNEKLPGESRSIFWRWAMNERPMQYYIHHDNLS